MERGFLSNIDINPF